MQTFHKEINTSNGIIRDQLLSKGDHFMKIAIIGSGGAGKSTFARKLGQDLNQKVYHLDALFWKPNWALVPRVEQIQVQNDLVQQKDWIIDGNYGATIDIRLHAADTIIFLDYPRVICLYRAIKRTIQYRKQSRPDMGEGCEERFDLTFLKWIWEYPKTKRPETMSKLQQLSSRKHIVILKSPREARRYLEAVSRSGTLPRE